RQAILRDRARPAPVAATAGPAVATAAAVDGRIGRDHIAGRKMDRISGLLRNPREMIAELNERSREILRHVVEAYVETGEPVGSRTLSRRLGLTLSPATIRNTMADLEEAGLLFAPHTSAGRLPTDMGLRLFV